MPCYFTTNHLHLQRLLKAAILVSYHIYIKERTDHMREYQTLIGAMFIAAAILVAGILVAGAISGIPLSMPNIG